MMWIRFIAEYCPKVPFILKIDDDVAVDYIGLLRFLSSRVRRRYIPLKKLVMCHIMEGSAAIRDKRSKWYISEAEYAEKFFSAYCSGLAFILTGDIIRPMLSVAQKAPFIWVSFNVDDFFLSGYLAVKANAILEDIGSLYELNANKALDAMKNGLKLFAVVRNVDHHKLVWKELSSRYE
ncbi:unnamed protein product [Toxocara canis]|uniref:Hexosyltransferase n=1 Tax=Toxocara canis TaxID=6265 RepID=A0A3P7GPJ8_TOXCA|nr:unnamed protein product [Toxocara canis]